MEKTNNLLNITLGENNSIKSIDLVDIINEFRTIEGKHKLAHYDFMKKIRKEVETLKSLGLDNAGNFSLVKYIDTKGEERPCFELTRDGMLQMLNSESTLVRYKTIEYVNKLEEQNKQLKSDLVEVSNIAISDKEQKQREYETKKITYSWRNIKTVLLNCNYTNLESTVNDIINFHVNVLKKKDRSYSYSELDNTQYKQNVRSRIHDILDEIFNNTQNGLLRDVSGVLKDKILSDTISTVKRSTSHKINDLQKKIEIKENENNQLKKAYKPNDEDYVIINEYPISKNSLYVPVLDFKTNKPRLICSDKYNKWKYWFKVKADKAGLKEAFKDIDFDKDVYISYKVKAPNGYDISNLINPLQDVLKEYFNCKSDQKFHIRNSELEDYYTDINDGQIKLHLSNEEANKEQGDN